MSAARSGDFTALIPTHAVTTIFYLVERASDTSRANQTVDWLLQHFDVPAADKPILLRARNLPLKDFEDAVVASLAEKHACDYVITRNVPDFAGSPVPTVSPAEFLLILQSRRPHK